MWWRRVGLYLFPGAAEKQPGFRHEIERTSANALLVIGALQIAISAFMLLARFFISPDTAAFWLRFRQAAFIVFLGGINIVASRLDWMERWARLLGCISGLATAAVLIWSSLVMQSISTNPNDFIPGQITLILLMAVTILPLQPMQVLLLGLAIGSDYFFSARYAEATLLSGLGPDENYILFVAMLTLLCTAITAVLYAQRRSHYDILQQTVEASDALRDVQARIMLSETASTLSRLAAAVSHEMNNPLGALLSGVDTLLLLAARQAGSKPEEMPRLVRVQGDVRRSVQESAQRLRDLMGRMQRFTNLDQGEVQSADLNDLLKDVAGLADPNLRKGKKLELNLEPLPPVICKPGQLSIVFSNLLDNALHAVNGDGRITISTHNAQKQVEVAIEDNGRGVSPEELPHIFDPDFRASGGRMAAVNWSMFNSRQIIREHGGDIEIASQVGRGTRISVTLPVGADVGIT